MKSIDLKVISAFIKNIWAFQLLDPEHLQTVATVVTIKQLRPEEILWLQGQQITFFTIVFSGKLRSVRRNSSGSEKLLSILTQGHHFGLAEMVTGVKSTVTIIADEPSTILAIKHSSLRKVLLSNADICYRLMQTMARTIFKLTSELERTSFETVAMRLARLLHQREKRDRTILDQKQPAAEIILHASHEELARQLGVNRETISRTLAKFRRQGLIETGYRSIRVLEPGRLAKLMFRGE